MAGGSWSPEFFKHRDFGEERKDREAGRGVPSDDSEKPECEARGNASSEDDCKADGRIFKRKSFSQRKE